MTAKRAAGYSGGALLLLAWLASAGGVVSSPPEKQEPSRPVETAGSESLASEVHAQTERLKSRLASAPVPQEPFRNPFAFVRRAPAERRASKAPSNPVPAVTAHPPAEPAIELIGVAETATPAGLVRTAIISALSGELFLVKEGDTIATRYKVATVGANAVELTDLLQGSVRRLALRE